MVKPCQPLWDVVGLPGDKNVKDRAAPSRLELILKIKAKEHSHPAKQEAGGGDAQSRGATGRQRPGSCTFLIREGRRARPAGPAPRAVPHPSAGSAPQLAPPSALATPGSVGGESPMERDPSALDATPAPTALFAWVRDSAPAPGRLGPRGAQTLELRASAWADLGWAAEVRAPLRLWVGGCWAGGRRREGGREGSSWGDIGGLLADGVRTGGAAALWEEPASRAERLVPRELRGRRRGWL